MTYATRSESFKTMGKAMRFNEKTDSTDLASFNMAKNKSTPKNYKKSITYSKLINGITTSPDNAMLQLISSKEELKRSTANKFVSSGYNNHVQLKNNSVAIYPAQSGGVSSQYNKSQQFGIPKEKKKVAFKKNLVEFIDISARKIRRDSSKGEINEVTNNRHTNINRATPSEKKKSGNYCCSMF